jgi:hypothetical protein
MPEIAYASSLPAIEAIEVFRDVIFATASYRCVHIIYKSFVEITLTSCARGKDVVAEGKEIFYGKTDSRESHAVNSKYTNRYPKDSYADQRIG